MKVAINTTIDHELKQLAIEHGINFTDAVEFGVTFKLAERHVTVCPDCRLLKKMRSFQKLAEEKSQELENLKNPVVDEPNDFVTADKIETPGEEFDKVMADNLKRDKKNG